MSRFFCPKNFIKDNIAAIPKKESHHIVDVMRLAKGDEVVLFDGEGHEYIGRIETASNKGVVVQIKTLRTISPEGLREIILLQAIPKKAKMDFIVEKATELGVNKIIPIVSTRTIVELDYKKQTERAQRWRKISLEASRQCARIDIPAVSDVMKFSEALRLISDIDVKLIATLYEPSVKLAQALRDIKGESIAILIGPEGDFTPNEVDMATKAGAVAVSFGRRILKSDTAALFALSAIGYVTDV